MIKTIFFDLGNVLIFFSREKMFKQIAACTGLQPAALQELFFKQGWLEEYETGKISTLDMFQLIQTVSPKSFEPEELFDAASNIFTLNQEICPLVENLKAHGIRLVLLSNTSECHFTRTQVDYPILQLFDDFILSYKVGAAKPDPQIFKKALQSANCSPEHCFYTDDIPEFIASAKTVGLNGEVFTSVPLLKTHLFSRGCKFLHDMI